MSKMLLRNALSRMAGVLAVLAMLAGCSTFSQKLVAPELSLLGIQMMSTDIFAQKFKVRVLVKNPNDLEIPIRGIDYTIILMGDSFAEGVSSDQFLLPAKGEAEFDMLVTTNFVSSFGRLLSRGGGNKLQDLHYEIAGEVLVDKGMIRKIPFNHQGTVDISRSLGQKAGET
jgi:LEA14-like dessication related protein